MSKKREEAVVEHFMFSPKFSTDKIFFAYEMEILYIMKRFIL